MPMFVQPQSLVGTWRRFGEVGPVYEVIATGAVGHDGEQVMHIRVLESGEEVEYKLSAVLDDPLEG